MGLSARRAGSPVSCILSSPSWLLYSVSCILKGAGETEHFPGKRCGQQIRFVSLCDRAFVVSWRSPDQINRLEPDRDRRFTKSDRKLADADRDASSVPIDY